MALLRRVLLLALTTTTTANELFKAIDADNAAMVNVALKSGKSTLVNEPGPDGSTPMIYAASHGKHRAFKVRPHLESPVLPLACCIDQRPKLF